jgi:hypothetical protein
MQTFHAETVLEKDGKLHLCQRSVKTSHEGSNGGVTGSKTTPPLPEKRIKNKKSKSKPNEPSTAEPAS